MNIEDIKKIGDSVKEVSGLDIFDNTRRRDYVEMRALVCYVLRKKLRNRFNKHSFILSIRR